MSKQICAIEAHIDQVWDNLRIYTLPLHAALFVTLAAFEGYCALATTGRQPQGLPHLRQALGLLVPRLYVRCHTVRVKTGHFRGLRQSSLPYEYAAQALNYAQRYAWFAYHLTAYRLGWLACRVDERIITFLDVPQFRACESLVHHTLRRYRDDRSLDGKAIQEAYRESPSEHTMGSLRSVLRHVSSDELPYVIPAAVLAPIGKLVRAALPSPNVDRDTALRGYTIQQYYDVWVALSALMYTFLQACSTRYGTRPRQLAASRVLLTGASRLARRISDLTDLPLSVSETIINDLILDIRTDRPDIQVRPMIRIGGSDLVLVSPSLIFTSNWEVCLLRNWARSPGEYGDVVGSRKGRLVGELATAISSPGIEYITNRNVLDHTGAIVTDVDLAIFDASAGYLALIQLKWLIEPDSVQEESNAREELLKGVEQMRSCISLFNADTDRFMQDLFPAGNVSSAQVRAVRYLVICRGFYGFAYHAAQYSIHVLDYDITLDMLHADRRLSISERFERIIQRHSGIQHDISARLCYNSIRIAGYLCRTPGLTGATGASTLGAAREPPGARSPCRCGSGIMYRNCCSIIEALSEADAPYAAQ